jgi:hypothetical protein
MEKVQKCEVQEQRQTMFTKAKHQLQDGDASE